MLCGIECSVISYDDIDTLPETPRWPLQILLTLHIRARPSSSFLPVQLQKFNVGGGSQKPVTPLWVQDDPPQMAATYILYLSRTGTVTVTDALDEYHKLQMRQ